MLVWIWVTPGWEDDSVRINVDGWGGRAGVGCLPQTHIGCQEERVGWVQQVRYVTISDGA